MIINNKASEARWVDYNEDVKLLIRPFPFSQGVFDYQDEKAFAKSLWVQFDYCLQDWKGFQAEIDDGLIDYPYNDENKNFVFSFADDIRRFVIKTSSELSDEVVKDLGN
jgi:hypothetical protein